MVRFLDATDKIFRRPRFYKLPILHCICHNMYGVDDCVFYSKMSFFWQDVRLCFIEEERLFTELF
jgi:hypothetical protein